MVKEAIVLLMFFGSPATLQEYTVRDGLSECLKAKRTIERNVRSPHATEYRGSMRLACKKLKVEVDSDNRIIRFLSDAPSIIDILIIIWIMPKIIFIKYAIKSLTARNL